MVSFSQLPAVKKTPFLVQLEKLLAHFVTTLEGNLYILFIRHSVGPTKIGPKNQS